VDRGTQRFLRGLTVGADLTVIDTMRCAARLASQEVLFGPDDGGLGLGADEMGVEIQHYFHQRRRYAALSARRTPEEREALVQQGQRVDRLLRARVRAARRE